MTLEQFDALKPGDIVRGKMSGNAFIIIDVQYKDGKLNSAIAVRTVTVTEPRSWILVEGKL